MVSCLCRDIRPPLCVPLLTVKGQDFINGFAAEICGQVLNAGSPAQDAGWLVGALLGLEPTQRDWIEGKFGVAGIC